MSSAGLEVSFCIFKPKIIMEAFIFNFFSWDLDAAKTLRCHDIVWQLKHFLVFIKEQVHVNVYFKMALNGRSTCWRCFSHHTLMVNAAIFRK